MQLSQALPETLRHSRAISVLEKSLAQSRLGHGILLHGENPDDLNKIVRAIAASLLQSDRDPFEHPDCFTLRPTGKARMIKIGTESERIAGEWPKNSMRRLVLDIQKTSNQGGRKVAILFEADRMNTQSANAFLKTLEEPPEGTTLFLLTSRPYQLLDTIRSRCLNFRIPSQSNVSNTPEISEWMADYKAWLKQLLLGPNKQSIPHIIMGAYGLNARFQSALSDITKEAWKQKKESLPEHITKDEIEAMETGMSRGYRTLLFGEIEKATSQFAREIEASNPGNLPVGSLGRAIETLEQATGLLELNFNQIAALEVFFLKSMRIWASAH